MSCKNCGTFDIVGPGHPAATYDADAGQHLITDRTALRHSHGDGCEPHPETGHYPLHFTFMFETAGAAQGGGE